MDFSALWKQIGEKGSKPSSTRFVIFLFILSSLIVPLINYGPQWVEVLRKEKPSPPTLGENIANEESQEQAKDSNCVVLAPLEKYDIEKEYEMIRKRGDFYYPTGGGNTWEGIIWIKRGLKPSFKEIFVEYEISSEESYGKPPAFIWIISRTASEGKRQHIAKLWVPEFSKSSGVIAPQLIGFAKTIDFDQGELERESSLELSDSVKRGKLDSLTIERTGISGNEMMINFTYNYTSDRNGVAMSFPFTKKVLFPFSNLASSGGQLDFGLGTFVGHGLRIVSLELCY